VADGTASCSMVRAMALAIVLDLTAAAAIAMHMMIAPMARATDPHRTERPNGTLVAGGADGTMMCPAIPVNTGLLRHRTARARATLI